MKNYSLSLRLQSDSDYTFHTYSESNVLNCVLDFQKLAHYQMKLAQLMRNHLQFYNCLVLCDRAMFSMGKAMYVHRNQIIPFSISLSMNDLLRLIRIDAEPCLDMVLFMGSVHYLVSGEAEASKETMKPEEVDMLLYKTDHILKRLSRRMVDDPSKRYPSIFKEKPLN
jgi:hypothetical protein